MHKSGTAQIRCCSKCDEYVALGAVERLDLVLLILQASCSWTCFGLDGVTFSEALALSVSCSIMIK